MVLRESSAVEGNMFQRGDMLYDNSQYLPRVQKNQGRRKRIWKSCTICVVVKTFKFQQVSHEGGALHGMTGPKGLG